jgi:hypothetical protein
MFNFLNSPPGPLGAAGQSSNSTQPPNIFSNAPQAFGGNLGKGLGSFADRMKGISESDNKLSALFQTLFGADGGLLNPAEAANNVLGGQAPGMGQRLNVDTGGGQIQNMLGGGNGSSAGVPGSPAPVPNTFPGNAPMTPPGMGGAVPGAGAPGGAPGAGGFLSRFMQGNNQR